MLLRKSRLFNELYNVITYQSLVTGKDLKDVIVKMHIQHRTPQIPPCLLSLR